MQKFGIEIRRVGDTRNLYRDVDTVLRRYEIQSNKVSDLAKTQTAAHALQKMISIEMHFSVCTIDACASVCQICISKERKDVYQAAHCMRWGDMLPDYRELLVAMVLDDFRTVLCPDDNTHPQL